MSHLAFQPAGPPLTLDCDVVVVGSGAGGASVAAHAARLGLSVVVVEAGAWRDPDQLPSGFYGALRDVFDDWQSGLTVGPALWPVVQGRGVGGTTLINSAICVRTPPDVLDDWHRSHGLDRAWLVPALERHQDDLERELGIEDVDVEAPVAGAHNRLAEHASRALGGSAPPMRRFVLGCAGEGRCTVGCRAGRKQSLDRTLVPQVLERGGTVLSCAPVERVLLKDRRAVGVTGRFVHPRTRARGATFTVHARRAVVVAASATQTPVLLARSGVRSPALGRRFMAHPGAGVLGLYDRVIDQHHGATQGWASQHWKDQGFKLETLSLPLEMLAARVPGGGTALMDRLARTRHLSHIVLALRATTEGRVRVGLGGKPLITYALNVQDLHRLRQGLHLVAQHHVQAGATAVMPGLGTLPPVLDPDHIDRILDVPLKPRHFLAILSHLFGGAVMGDDPRRSVCDAHGRVWGYRGLVVACAAAVPTTLGVNPQHTLMALARIRAEELAAPSEIAAPT